MTPESKSKREFLLSMRVARNLFRHPQRVETDSPTIDAAAVSKTLEKAAIWLTPGSVAEFNIADFPELSVDQRESLECAVRDFLGVAMSVPGDKPPTNQQYLDASDAFDRILKIINPYLPVPNEGRKVEKVLRAIDFPTWVVNWDYELGNDWDGDPAVWVMLYVEQTAPRSELTRYALRMMSEIRDALSNEGIDRLTYVRVRTSKEHKAIYQHGTA